MTIDEAIIGLEKEYNTEQLVEWLKELKEYKKREQFFNYDEVINEVIKLEKEKSYNKAIENLMEYLDLECSQYFDNDYLSSNREPMYLCSDINKWIEGQTRFSRILKG